MHSGGQKHPNVHTANAKKQVDHKYELMLREIRQVIKEKLKKARVSHLVSAIITGSKVPKVQSFSHLD